jgi:hypothetical protein
MIDPSHKGRVFPAFSYTVERGKLREFLIAIGDDQAKADAENAVVPPTFPTVFAFWGGLRLEGALNELDIELKNVIHAEQEYDYLEPVRVGDTVTGQLTVSDVYSKGGRTGALEFLELILNYENQNRRPVLRERTLLVVRGKESGE